MMDAFEISADISAHVYYHESDPKDRVIVLKDTIYGEKVLITPTEFDRLVMFMKDWVGRHL